MTGHGMFARTLFFFKMTTKQFFLLVKFQITTSVPFQNDATCLGICIHRTLGREWVEEKQANIYLSYLLLGVFIRDQFIKETNLINKIIYSAVHHNTKAATCSTAEKYTIRVRKFCKYFWNA